LTIIEINVTKKEFGAIREYASMCDESISCLIHKIVIQEITLMKSRSAKDPEGYDYNMIVPSGISDYEEQKIIESNYNKIRTMLGWEQIRVS